MKELIRTRVAGHGAVNLVTHDLYHVMVRMHNGMERLVLDRINQITRADMGDDYEDRTEQAPEEASLEICALMPVVMCWNPYRFMRRIGRTVTADGTYMPPIILGSNFASGYPTHRVKIAGTGEHALMLSMMKTVNGMISEDLKVGIQEDENSLIPKMQDMDLIEVIENLFDHDHNNRNGIRFRKIEEELKQDWYVFIEDFHLYVEQKRCTPDLVAAIREASRYMTKFNAQLVLCSPYELEIEGLERTLPTIVSPFPDRRQVRQIVTRVAPAWAKNGINHAVVDACVGMTELEMERALNLSLIENGEPSVEVLQHEKAQSIQKSQALSLVDTRGMDHTLVGGLDRLKAFIQDWTTAFTDEARDQGLPYPKGILLAGVPGTGKSLISKVIGAILQQFVLRLDMGAVFGQLVGQSEGNMRQVLAIAEAMSPALLWFDEIEKAFGGGVGGGNTRDGNTSGRVFQTYLTWRQETQKPVATIATSNDIRTLPAEMLRAGRFDAIFFLDVPNVEERDQIVRLHLRHPSRKLQLHIDSEAGETFEQKVERIVRASNGYTGAEIEQAVINAMRADFTSWVKAGSREGECFYHEETLVRCLQDINPIAVAEREKVEAMRKSGQKYRLASSPSEQVCHSGSGEPKVTLGSAGDSRLRINVEDTF